MAVRAQIEGANEWAWLAWTTAAGCRDVREPMSSRLTCARDRSRTEGSLSSPESPVPAEDLLTPRQAFLAMTDFIWEFAMRAGDDLLTLIGDTGLEADGLPTDPAAWDDWLASVATSRSGKAPRSE